MRAMILLCAIRAGDSHFRCKVAVLAHYGRHDPTLNLYTKVILRNL